MRWGRYRSRTDAGRVLADSVAARVPAGHVVVLGLARGGVPVAAEVATRLDAPLDVLTVRKIGTPGHVELAIGAIASGGLVVRNDDLIARLGLSDADVAARVAVARQELDERDARLRGDRPPPALAGVTVVLVDDGLATGATMRAAVAAVRTAGPTRVIVAVPVGPPDTVAELTTEADDVVCPRQPPDFMAVGEWYREFGETTDAEVVALLSDRGQPDRRDAPSTTERDRSGERDLEVLLRDLDVTRRPGTFAYVHVAAGTPPPPVVVAMIDEGATTTYVVDADSPLGQAASFRAAWLTLTVHSALEAVGLTAAVATALATADIPANVLAGYLHDHVLVPEEPRRRRHQDPARPRRQPRSVSAAGGTGGCPHAALTVRRAAAP